MSDQLPAPVSDQWMGMVQQFMQRPEASIDMLERLLALREKEMRDRAQVEFNTAFARCQANVSKAEKDKPNPLFRSRYASIGAMYDAVWPAVMAEGFNWTVTALKEAPAGWDNSMLWFQGKLSKGIISDTVELPIAREALTVIEGPKGGRPAMNATQALGSLTTYMRKYLLGLMFSVVTAEDEALDNDGGGGRPLPDKPKGPSPKEWLEQFETRLQACQTREEFEALVASRTVQEAKRTLNGGDLNELWRLEKEYGEALSQVITPKDRLQA